jgi:hypothetical protein
MATLFVELESAMQAEITPKVLDILIEIAKEARYHDDKEFAVEILVLALQYPMRMETLGEAENMYSSLETELCPRVIRDAWDQAQRMTLEDMVTHVLAHTTE